MVLGGQGQGSSASSTPTAGTLLSDTGCLLGPWDAGGKAQAQFLFTAP